MGLHQEGERRRDDLVAQRGEPRRGRPVCGRSELRRPGGRPGSVAVPDVDAVALVAWLACRRNRVVTTVHRGTGHSSDGEAITAIILAAGVGRRLGTARTAEDPAAVRRPVAPGTPSRRAPASGVEDFGSPSGTEGADRGEVDRLGLGRPRQLRREPALPRGQPGVALGPAERLRGGRPVLLMDGDVLYDRRMIGRLLAAPGRTCCWSIARSSRATSRSRSASAATPSSISASGPSTRMTGTASRSASSASRRHGAGARRPRRWYVGRA